MHSKTSAVLPGHKPTLPTPGVRLMRGALLVASTGSLLLYFGLVLLRIGYPFELEIFEGVLADHVSRILQGLPLYAKPSLDYSPSIYPPLYYYLSAGLAQCLGFNLWVLRLASVVASVGCLGILFAYVRRETDSRYFAFLSAGFYAASYGVCGGWFDVARVDSLLLFLLLSAMYLLRFGKTPLADVSTGILLALAVFTKQTALPASLPVLCIVSVLHPRRAGWLLLPFGLLVVGGSFAMDVWQEGWFCPYMWGYLFEHSLRIGHGLDFWTRHVAIKMPIVSIAALGGLYLGIRNWKTWREQLFLPTLGGGFLIASWIGQWSEGGAENSLMPDCALFALLVGILFQKAAQRFQSPKIQMAFYFLLLVQFALVAYDPRIRVPSRADREAGEALVERLKHVEGDVWVAFHGHLGPMAGKPIRATYYSPFRVLAGGKEQVPVCVWESLNQAVREQRFAEILFDGHSLPHGWDQYYEEAGPVFPRPDVFWPVSGGKTRPKTIFVPRTQP